MRGHRFTLALMVWLAAFVVGIGAWLGGYAPSISYGVYAEAAARWLAREPLYDLTTIEGFQYFPQSALLAVPFALLGSPVGDTAWRILGWGLCALGVWRLSKLNTPHRSEQTFLIATLLCIGVTMGPLINGQANLLLAALTLHAAADLIRRRWSRAAVVLGLGLALTPLMVALLLLVWVLYRPMRWRVPAALAVVLLAPWCCAEPAYVYAQFQGCWAKLRLASAPAPRYEDLRGLLATAGWVVPHGVALATQLLAALGVLALGWRARLRLKEPHVTMLVAAFAAAFITLFNPRAQTTTYAVPATIAAVLAASCFVTGHRRLGAAFAVIVGLWTLDCHWLPFIELWLKPLVGVAFVAVLVRQIIGAPTQPARVSSALVVP